MIDLPAVPVSPASEKLHNDPGNCNEQTAQEGLIMVGALVSGNIENRGAGTIYNGAYLAARWNNNHWLPVFAVCHVPGMYFSYGGGIGASKTDQGGGHLPDIFVNPLDNSWTLSFMEPDEVVPLRQVGRLGMFTFSYLGRAIKSHFMEAEEAEAQRELSGRPPMFIIDSNYNLQFLKEGEAIP